MKPYTLLKDAPRRVAKAGPILHVVNQPTLAQARSGETLAGYTARVWGGAVLVGFDQVPTVDNFDLVVPPFADAVAVVPEIVQDCVFVYLSSTVIGNGPAPNNAIDVLVDWPADGLPGIRPVAQALPTPVPGDGGPSPHMILGTDYNGGVWAPAPAAVILDQQLGVVVGGGGPINPHLRPKIAPSLGSTFRVASAINTLFAINDQRGMLHAQGAALNSYFQVVHRLIVSVSAATLFVVGNPDLAVNAAGNSNEIARVAFPGAGTQVIEFGEGIEVYQTTGGGTWMAWTSAAVTVDITVIWG